MDAAPSSSVDPAPAEVPPSESSVDGPEPRYILNDCLFLPSLAMFRRIQPFFNMFDVCLTESTYYIKLDLDTVHVII